MANTSILAAFERMWQHVVTALNGKSDLSHDHNSLYYTENEINTKLSSIRSEFETKDDAETKLNESRSYTDEAILDLTSHSDVNNAITAHNTSSETHNDIRLSIGDLITKLDNFLNVDDETVDQLSEVLALIENNRGTLESITVNKVNVTDIIDDLITANNSKVLSANQGVIINGLIDVLRDSINTMGEDISDLAGDIGKVKNLVGDVPIPTQIADILIDSKVVTVDMGGSLDDMVIPAQYATRDYVDSEIAALYNKITGEEPNFALVWDGGSY